MGTQPILEPNRNHKKTSMNASIGYSTTQFTRIVIAIAIVQKKVGLNEPLILLIVEVPKIFGS